MNFSICFVFSLLYNYEIRVNNELIIFWNFGVHKITIINFIFKDSINFLMVQIFLTSFVVPKSQDLERSFLRSSTVNFFDNFIKPRKFIDTIKGVTIYTDNKDTNGNLNNLYLKKEIDKNEFQVTYAKKGKFKQIGDIPILVLYEGSTITSKNDEVTNFSFSKSDFSLANLESNTTTYKKTQEISSYKLIQCINSFYKFDENEFKLKTKLIENCSIRNINNILKEFYKRFIIPFYIPIFCLIPFLLITSSKENLNYNKLKLITFIYGLVAVIFSEITIRFISEITLQNIGIIITPILLFLLIYFFLFYKFNFKILKK